MMMMMMMMMMGELFLLGIKQTRGHKLPKFSNVCLAINDWLVYWKMRKTSCWVWVRDFGRCV